MMSKFILINNLLFQLFIKILYLCPPIKNHDRIHRGVEQLVARRAHNPKATGSSPVPATKKNI